MSDVKSIFDISGRSLGALQTRLNTIASNIANAGTKAGSKENAYKALRPVFESVFSEAYDKQGVASVDAIEIVGLNREPKKSFEPDHPMADKDGYIYEAAVNIEEELVELVEASRQYQNNLEVISTTKSLMLRTINMGK